MPMLANVWLRAQGLQSADAVLRGNYAE